MLYLLLPVSFIPIILMLIWFRNIEINHRESWSSIVIIFLWGTTFAVLIALILEELVMNYIVSFFILSVIIVPIIEEITKALGLRFIKSKITELEDGLIYGAVAGFGFAATENLIYGARFWDEGFIVLLSLFYIRTIGTSILHASTTSLIGFGYSNKILKNKTIMSIIPYGIIAISVHALYNLLVYSTQLINHIIGIVLAVVFIILIFSAIHKKIKYLDKKDEHKKSYVTNP